MSTSPQQLASTLAPSLEPLGLLVEDVTVIPAGKRRLVRVLIDRDLPLELTTERTEPVSLDEVTDATRVISDELDRSDVMGAQPYTLEVSSPGTDRPLTLPRHFVRNVGRLAAVALEDGGSVSGRITAAGPDGVTLTPEQGGKKGGPKPSAQPQELNYTSITSAKVQVEFTRGDDADGVGEDV